MVCQIHACKPHERDGDLERCKSHLKDMLQLPAPFRAARLRIRKDRIGQAATPDELVNCHDWLVPKLFSKLSIPSKVPLASQDLKLGSLDGITSQCVPAPSSLNFRLSVSSLCFLAVNAGHGVHDLQSFHRQGVAASESRS